jgi:hypothetical protein
VNPIDLIPVGVMAAIALGCEWRYRRAAGRRPRRAASLSDHEKAGSARRAGNEDLADASRERLDCGCRWFSENGDRGEWIPCARHLEDWLKEGAR